ncbi:MAG: hypothetical protein D6769_03875 [Methanobacteriota archaeon]|nr:MAG: hypothetical protein D6769_03875 [Euryarchaeota archaeon]
MKRLLLFVFLLSFAFSTQINSCQQISDPGTYTLTKSLDNINYVVGGRAGKSCIFITANDVTLDCQGHSLTYLGTENVIGIQVDNNKQGITIKNCLINGFYKGMTLFHSSNLLVDGNTIYGSMEQGIDSTIDNSIISNNNIEGNKAGILVGGSGNTIEGNTVNNNADFGIRVVATTSIVANDNTINSNTIFGGNIGISSYGSATDIRRTSMTNNNITSTATAIQLHNSQDGTITDNIITGNAIGIKAISSSGNTISNNIACTSSQDSTTQSYYFDSNSQGNTGSGNTGSVVDDGSNSNFNTKPCDVSCDLGNMVVLNQDYLPINITFVSDNPITTSTIYLYNRSISLLDNPSVTDPADNFFFHNFTNLGAGIYLVNASTKDSNGNIGVAPTKIYLLTSSSCPTEAELSTICQQLFPGASYDGSSGACKTIAGSSCFSYDASACQSQLPQNQLNINATIQCPNTLVANITDVNNNSVALADVSLAESPSKSGKLSVDVVATACSDTITTESTYGTAVNNKDFIYVQTTDSSGSPLDRFKGYIYGPLSNPVVDYRDNLIDSVAGRSYIWLPTQSIPLDMPQGTYEVGLSSCYQEPTYLLVGKGQCTITLHNSDNDLRIRALFDVCNIKDRRHSIRVVLYKGFNNLSPGIVKIYPDSSQVSASQVASLTKIKSAPGGVAVFDIPYEPPVSGLTYNIEANYTDSDGVVWRASAKLDPITNCSTITEQPTPSYSGFPQFSTSGITGDGGLAYLDFPYTCTYTITASKQGYRTATNTTTLNSCFSGKTPILDPFLSSIPPVLPQIGQQQEANAITLTISEPKASIVAETQPTVIVNATATQPIIEKIVLNVTNSTGDIIATYNSLSSPTTSLDMVEQLAPLTDGETYSLNAYLYNGSSIIKTAKKDIAVSLPSSAKDNFRIGMSYACPGDKLSLTAQDTSGNVVSGVTVILSSPTTPSISSITDTKGEAAFSIPSSSQYNLALSKNGFNALQRDILIVLCSHPCPGGLDRNANGFCPSICPDGSPVPTDGSLCPLPNVCPQGYTYCDVCSANGNPPCIQAGSACTQSNADLCLQSCPSGTTYSPVCAAAGLGYCVQNGLDPNNINNCPPPICTGNNCVAVGSDCDCSTGDCISNGPNCQICYGNDCSWNGNSFDCTGPDCNKCSGSNCLDTSWLNSKKKGNNGGFSLSDLWPLLLAIGLLGGYKVYKDYYA